MCTAKMIKYYSLFFSARTLYVEEPELYQSAPCIHYVTVKTGREAISLATRPVQTVEKTLRQSVLNAISLIFGNVTVQNLRPCNYSL